MACMEDVLELYAEPYDPKCPVVCFDETSKQLVAEKSFPIPAKAGRRERFDYEYKRNGTRNLFMLCEPLAGWRHLEVTCLNIRVHLKVYGDGWPHHRLNPDFPYRTNFFEFRTLGSVADSIGVPQRPPVHSHQVPLPCYASAQNRLSVRVIEINIRHGPTEQSDAHEHANHGHNQAPTQGRPTRNA